MWGIFPGGNFPGAHLWGIVLGGNFLGAFFRGALFPGEFFRTPNIYSQVDSDTSCKYSSNKEY